MARNSVRAARSAFQDLRDAAWHFRQGGWAQVRKWWGRRDARALRHAELSELFDTPIVRDSQPNRRPSGPRAVAGCILDEFSEKAWSAALDLRPLSPHNWTSIVEAGLDLLLVESAWSGSSGAWKGQLTGPSAPTADLRALVERCRAEGIPSAFWNKEDPPHFEDFLDTARLFDWVFTTDEGVVPRYRAELGHDRVAVMPFAAAEHLHHPLRLRHGQQSRDVAFAGTYFAQKFPERRQQMEVLLGGALDASGHMEHGLDIFSRFDGGDDKYQFPDEFRERVVGALSYEDMLVAYKAYKVALNVNTVVDSPTMCARRVFELLASGTAVVSTHSDALPRYFDPGEVPIVDTREQAADVVRALINSPLLRDRIVHAAQRKIWENHTYRIRATELLTTMGLPAEMRRPSVSALMCTNRPHQVRHALESAAAQQAVDLQVVLVTHGFEVSDRELRSVASELGLTDLQLARMPDSESLGACLRRAVDMADGAVLTKMDDDDYYAPNYLRDQINALGYSGASLVGKQAHYMHLASMGMTVLRFGHKEHRWTDIVMGPTMTGHRDVFVDTPFADRSIGEDTDFQSRIRRAGGSIYSADRFNFVQWRGAQHTWEVGDWRLAAGGEARYFGSAPDALRAVSL